jgi:Helicase associated domain
MGQKKSMICGVGQESLLSMALYDLEPTAFSLPHSSSSNNGGAGRTVEQPSQVPQARPPVLPPGLFHPVDEYKDLTLREILDLSDDYLFPDEPAPANPQNNMAQTPADIVSSAPRLFGASFGTGTAVTPITPEPKPHNIVSPPFASFDDYVADSVESSSAPISKKRSRDEESLLQEGDDDFDDGTDEEGRRFRPYQAGQWAEKFDELCQYRSVNGHCLVPHTYGENLSLARWVKRQRYQYKLMLEGKQSTMTPERVTALEDIGFVWDSQGAAWDERLQELALFQRTFRHCNVPSNYHSSPQLATWVKCQRTWTQT